MIARFIALTIFLFLSPVSHAKTTVNVGITANIPPFATDTKNKVGLVYDVINELNKQQSNYQFIPYFFPAKRLLETHKAMNIHLIAYNDVSWGWKQRGGQASINLTDGSDVFFTLKNNQTTQLYPKELAAVRGFHYAFANYDPQKAEKMSNLHLVNNEEQVIRLVINHRVQKGIASASLLRWLAISQPQTYKQLNIDYDQPDHHYNRQLVVMESSPISLKALNRLLTKEKIRLALTKIYQRYGLSLPNLD